MTGKFGPNTAEVEKFLGEYMQMTPFHAEALVDAWKAVPHEKWQGAFARAIQVEGAQERRLWCGEARSQMQNARWIGVLHFAPSLRLAIDAAMSAVMALIFRDLISPEDFATLYRPWREVMEVDYERPVWTQQW